ncbi:MAG: hypothetical protein LBK60_01730 [Verrucomicrobiales bacterium]|jgi:hypothetical protein|nr:hypothetical protein [Verrucomicrobiales bacterium]
MKSTLQRFLPAGALGISLLLHLMIFLGISGVILIQAVVPKLPFVADGEAYAPADHQPLPPDFSDDLQPDNPTVEPIASDLPSMPVSNLDPIVSTAASTLAPNIFVMPTLPSGGAVGGVRPASAADSDDPKPAKTFSGPRQMTNPFGNLDAQGDPHALVGYMYDFKQTPGHVKTNINFEDYRKTIHRYVTNGWDNGQLRKFFRVPQPLAAYQIFIPTMKADLAPAAFKAEKYVEPRLWIIVYKGKFVAPSTGTYRFAGLADDIIIVRLGDQNVLDGGLFPISEYTHNSKTFKDPRARVNGLFSGEWFQLEAGKSYPLAVLIGEQPGGGFSSLLVIQKKGQDDFSAFQMARTKMPDSYKNWPPLSKKAFISRSTGEE